MALVRVVLPHPLGPTRPKISPRSICMSMPLSATIPPKRRSTDWHCNTGPVLSPAKGKIPPPHHLGSALAGQFSCRLSRKANERSISWQAGQGAAAGRSGETAGVEGHRNVALQWTLFAAEIGLAFLPEGGNAFAGILVHEEQRKAVDRMAHIVAQPRLRADLFGEGEGVRQHLGMRHDAERDPEPAGFLRRNRIA